jgi:hypothetical protein
MPKLLAVIVAILFLGGGYLYIEKDNEYGPAWNPFRTSKKVEVTDGATQGQAAPTGATQAMLPDDSHITNFEECIAAGFPPLKDAPDKCLTSGGHLFIKGVVEE